VTAIDNLQDATAVILAGGLGTRLRAVVADRPKILAPVHRKPFLAYLLEYLAAEGLRKAVLCVGYRSEQVMAALGKSYAGLRLAYSMEPSPLGTGGALRLALPLADSGPVIAMNGDSFCRAPLRPLWQWHHACRAAGTLLLTRVEDTARYGCVGRDENGQLTAFEEKGEHRGPGWISAGVYVLSRRMIQEIGGEKAVSLEREVFPRWLGRGLYGWPCETAFLDIGTPESYSMAEAFFASQEAR